MISPGLEREPEEASAEPEIMSFGPPVQNRRTRRILLTCCVVVALFVAGAGIWTLVPKPRPDLTAADLAGVYAGMVRSDGTNDVSTLNRAQHSERPVAISPTECTPLFDTTLSNQVPAGAIDGISTYWLNAGNASISLTTYLYRDTKAAAADYAAVVAALDGCVNTDLTVGRDRDVALERQQVIPAITSKTYLSYVVSNASDSGRFPVDLVQLNNTITWQYRYDYGAASAYSPVPAQQLMVGLISLMHAAQDTHRR
jgi:hypothetical protein